MKFEELSKLEAAERMVKEAICLFFERRDPLAIHIIASSAHQVLFDIGNKQGITGFLKDLSIIRPERRKEVIQMLNDARNFLKHAVQDPDKKLKFYPEPNEFWIFDSIHLYNQITGKTPFEFGVFWGWFISKRTNLLYDKYKKTIEGMPDRQEFVDDFDSMRKLLNNPAFKELYDD